MISYVQEIKIFILISCTCTLYMYLKRRDSLFARIIGSVLLCELIWN